MKVSIIAEIGSNWEGSMNKAEKIIKECKKGSLFQHFLILNRAQNNIGNGDNNFHHLIKKF